MLDSKYKIAFIILFLLSLLSIGGSFSNYFINLKTTKEQLKSQSLPLSIDNIYTSIQKHIIEPSLVASMMANDTFVKDWILHDENNTKKIKRYLDSVKNKYEMLATFLVSSKSLNYYTQDGFIEKLTKEKTNNQWYFKFRHAEIDHEINLDFNNHIAKHLIMFINYKIFDDKYNYIGATGVAIRISYIEEMLETFRSKYKLDVNFIDSNNNLLFDTKSNHLKKRNLSSSKSLAQHEDVLLSKINHSIEYEQDGEDYLINTKYIKELDIHLIVKAKLDDFTKNTKANFRINLLISIILAFIIAIIIIKLIHDNNKKLEKLADYDLLTNIPNRRNFSDKFEHLLLLSKRNHEPLSLLFIDIDDFKNVNDTFGHDTGDIVLKEFAATLSKQVRVTDIYARWGGEEFTVTFVGSTAEDALMLANKIRENIKDNIKLKTLLGYEVTISCGVIQCLETDTIDMAISRADQAMYQAKLNGKDQVFFAQD